jgi:hypothetical protein
MFHWSIGGLRVTSLQPQSDYRRLREVGVGPAFSPDATEAIVAHQRSVRTPSPDASRATIANLLHSVCGTLEVAEELARITGHGVLSEEIGSARCLMDRLAASAQQIPRDELDDQSLGAALMGSIELSAIVGKPISPALQFHLGERIRTCLPDLGPGEVSVLLCLLVNCDRFVTKSDLQLAAKSRTPKGDVIKVYVSRIRASLGRFYLESAIETGRNSYRFDPEQARLLLEAISTQ